MLVCRMPTVRATRLSHCNWRWPAACHRSKHFKIALCRASSVDGEAVVGIDLGTTNSAVAIVEGGKPICIPNSDGETTIPSVVAILPEGEVLVGKNAKRQAVVNPVNTYHSVKRVIGTKYKDLGKDAEQFTYRVIEDDEGVAVLECSNVDVGYLYPEEVSAQVVAQLLANAAAYSGIGVKKAVISVPAYFKEPQVQATISAGKLAGLEVVRIIREPVAAALAYGIDLQQDETVVVFDLGGGTFDVSILEVGNGVIEVLATGGDMHLGGDDWDQAIISWLANEHLQPAGVDCSDPRLQANLRALAEFAKLRLSDAKEVTLRMPVGGTGGGPLELVLTRQKFEDLTKALFERCRAPLDNACWQAGVDLLSAVDRADAASKKKGPSRKAKGSKAQPVLKPKRGNPVGKVLLVGGSTRMPAVRRFITNMTGIKPVVKDINPDEAVALGAAVQAGIFQGQVSDLMVMDVWQSALLRAFAREQIQEQREQEAAASAAQPTGPAAGPNHSNANMQDAQHPAESASEPTALSGAADGRPRTRGRGSQIRRGRKGRTRLRQLSRENDSGIVLQGQEGEEGLEEAEETEEIDEEGEELAQGDGDELQEGKRVARPRPKLRQFIRERFLKALKGRIYRW